MPTFCRHGGVFEACPICRSTIQSPTTPARRTPRAKQPFRPRSGPGKSAPARGGVRVSREARAADDGYRCLLVPGLRAEIEARRLARELAFACGRLARLATDPPGLFAEAASEPDLEEATWLAFIIVHLSPLETVDPFVGIRAARTTWSSGAPPLLDGVAFRPPQLGRRDPVAAHARRLPPVGGERRLAGGRLHGRPGLESGAALRARLRAALPPRVRPPGPL